MSLLSILGSVTQAVRRTAGSLAARPPARRKRSESRRLELEHLETRDLMAPLAIGTEVERPTEYMAGYMFTDALRASTPWRRSVVDTALPSNGWSDDHTIPIDPRTGAPTMLRQWTDPTTGHLMRQEVSTSMFVGSGNHYPRGTYTAWWQGDGRVEFGGDVIVSSVVRGETTGSDGQQYHTASFTVSPGRTSSATQAGHGIELTVTPTSANDANPFHDAHLWMPDYNGQSFVGQMWQPGASFSPFHPLFTERLAPFRTLRFMDAMATCESTVEHWSDRRPWSFMTQVDAGQRDGYTVAAGFHSNGMAPEYMIALANALHADIWINVPHLADPAEATASSAEVRNNSYVLQLANLVHDTLDRNLHVYLEYSNELWNTAFVDAHGWINRQLGGNPTVAEFTRFAAQQETRVFSVWSGVFNDRPGQLTRVLAGAPADHEYNAALLQAMRALEQPGQGRNFDAFSVSAYLWARHRPNTTVGQALADLRSSMPVRISELRDARDLARQHGVGLVAYEGGIMLETWTLAPETELSDSLRRHDSEALNRAAIDPRIYGIFSDFLRQLNTTGLEFLSNMQYTQRGTLDNLTSIRTDGCGLFGALSYQDQPLGQAHKYRALLNFMAGTSTTLSADVAAPVAGQTVTLSARVEANAIRPEVVSGTVRFYDGGTLLGTGTVVNGVATFQTASLRVGIRTLRAIYDGDNSYTRSNSSMLRLTVARAAVDMTLISSVPESVFGQPITLTVQVAAAAPGSGTPTGTVTFRDGTTVLRTVRLVNGVATFTTSALRVGSRAISAVFSGDFRFLRASVDLIQTVNPQ